MTNPLTTDTRQTRATATAAVLRVLAGFPGGRALAGELEAVLAREGVSQRQARRWMHWAAAGAAVRSPKSQKGTTYCLPGREPVPPAPEAVSGLPAPELAAVPRGCRRDVALTLLSLLAVGGEAESRELARAVTERAGRPLLWGIAAVDVALGAAGRRVITYRRDTAPGTTVYYAVVALDPCGLEAWARETPLQLPADPGALERRMRRLLGDQGLPLARGEAEVLAALAGLGGTATPDELYAQDYADRRAASALVAAMRAPETRPSWACWDGGGRRLRLVGELWPEGTPGR